MQIILIVNKGWRKNLEILIYFRHPYKFELDAFEPRPWQLDTGTIEVGSPLINRATEIQS